MILGAEDFNRVVEIRYLLRCQQTAKEWQDNVARFHHLLKHEPHKLGELGGELAKTYMDNCEKDGKLHTMEQMRAMFEANVPVFEKAGFKPEKDFSNDEMMQELFDLYNKADKTEDGVKGETIKLVNDITEDSVNEKLDHKVTSAADFKRLVELTYQEESLLTKEQRAHNDALFRQLAKISGEKLSTKKFFDELDED